MHAPTISGSWRGLIGQLQRGEIDVTASLLPLEPDDSMKDIEFNAPTAYYVRAFLIQQPDPEEATVSPWFLATTFSPSVWLCFLSALISYICIIFGIRVLAASRQRRHPWMHISDSVMDVIRSPLNQMEPWPYIAPLRLTLNYMNVPIFVLMNFYTAYLTGSLMILGQPEDPFNGLNDLARLVYDKKFTLIKFNGNLRHSAPPNYSATDPEDVIHMAAAWNPPALATSVPEAVEMVANNKSLVLRGSYQLLQHASAFSCRTKLIEDQDTVPTWLTYAFRKNDPLLSRFSKLLANSALVDRYLKSSYKKYLRKRKCDDEVKRTPKFFALGLKQLRHAYYLLLYGFLASIPIFILEMLAKYLGRLFWRKPPTPVARPRALSLRQRSMKSNSVDVTWLWSTTPQPSPNVHQTFTMTMRGGSPASAVM